ncbi:I78 family peptidase inhibitor [Sphingomonas pituitosa]|uniref:I78 family peptidase inhibitor n=1 Tax=Sphingomonas pituitosa TaxID=99597 RepID=UPI000A71FF0F|nr:I78 family peptidase inhibitor [Sphingomonas pituitosa]
MRAIVFLALAGAAAGCAQQRKADPLPAMVECDANRVLDLKGKPRSPAIEADALARSGAKRIRWIEPGSAVTMDFRVDRLNLHVDKDGTITDARCG